MRKREAQVLASIAANVRRLRVRQGLTQEQLAELADLDVRRVQRIERATLNFGVVSLVVLAEALDVSVVQLVKPAHFERALPGRPRSQKRRAAQRARR